MKIIALDQRGYRKANRWNALPGRYTAMGARTSRSRNERLDRGLRVRFQNAGGIDPGDLVETAERLGLEQDLSFTSYPPGCATSNIYVIHRHTDVAPSFFNLEPGPISGFNEVIRRFFL